MASPAPQASVDELITGEAVALSVRPAGFLQRSLSGLIDIAVSVAVLLTLFALLAAAAPVLDEAALQAFAIVIVVVSLVLLPIAVEVLSHGRSLGRLAIGARIVRDDGGAAGLRHAFIRALTGTVELYLTVGGLAVLVAILHPRSKRLGDILAGTYAQYERMPRLSPALIPVPPQLAGWAAVADVAALPDALARRISGHLAHAARLSPEARAGLGEELAREASVYVSPLPNVDAATFLAGVSALRRERELRALDAEARRLAALTPALSRRPHAFPDR
ncbi:RDD family protein [Gryllotalpicola ginsengisoli]|uniref:RDD family protein n=1 Tax=Gryllotalpicola ginsengisoli TaxID=444608 RepID=UPI000488AA94|nr:RDD family protein [Gryllotalpicola ginsengisoli]